MPVTVLLLPMFFYRSPFPTNEQECNHASHSTNIDNNGRETSRGWNAPHNWRPKMDSGGRSSRKYRAGPKFPQNNHVIQSHENKEHQTIYQWRGEWQVFCGQAGGRAIKHGCAADADGTEKRNVASKGRKSGTDIRKALLLSSSYFKRVWTLIIRVLACFL